MVFFRDTTNANDPRSPTCIEHIRPFAELAGDLGRGAVAAYNFITPNLCDDMHDVCLPSTDRIRQGDDWLARTLPMITGSRAYTEGGAIFILWDEGDSGDGPIGLIVLSPLAKGNGYASSVRYDHSSTLLTLQEIFGILPPLRNAAQATDLRDLFRPEAFVAAPGS
jgi:hypothetical protein